MDKLDVLEHLYDTYPQKMIEDFAVESPSLGGPNYEAIEDHLHMVHKLSDEEIEQIRLFLFKRRMTELSLCEAVSDIAHFAGLKKYYGGDSRNDIADFIIWAKEFEHINRGVEWGVSDEREYIDEIAKFTLRKMGK